jgi:hypothetical protein
MNIAANDITRLRFGDVAERLTGRARSFADPPPSWAHWQQPVPALPIDEAISELRQSNRLHQPRQARS